ncbi:hypothetical protein [Ferruginibacter sp. SUN106]|uniref:hypothetical protein n=1 Tax=Ferruginibacter sp. SUN106 TaxID=2978348 RepID=UPI003D365D35
MIHKRFNHTRHLIWTAFILTVFTGPVISHRSNEIKPSQQPEVTEKIHPVQPVLINTVVIK